jgi:hypothetical protein
LGSLVIGGISHWGLRNVQTFTLGKSKPQNPNDK